MEYVKTWLLFTMETQDLQGFVPCERRYPSSDLALPLAHTCLSEGTNLNSREWTPATSEHPQLEPPFGGSINTRDEREVCREGTEVIHVLQLVCTSV